MTEKNECKQIKNEAKEAYGIAYLLELMVRMRYWILLCCAVLGLTVFVALRFVPCQYERTMVLKVDMSAYDGLRDSLPDADGIKVEFVRDRMEAKVMLLQSQPVVDNALKLMAEENAGTLELYRHNKPNFTVEYSKYSDVIRLILRTPDPQQADAFLQALVDSYNRAVQQNEVYDHAFITVIDPPHGSDKPVYPHVKLLYLLAVVLGVVLPLTWAELRDWWRSRGTALVITLVLLLPASVGAQSSSVECFQPLQSSGDFPADLAAVLKGADKNGKEDSFVLSMLEGGRVLYGTALNDYVQQVADKLLADYPQLKSEMKFYILKSPLVNAYSLDNGVVFVNVGLLAQLSNEGELAFVLAHEIAHYAEHHAVVLGKYDNKNQGADFVAYYLRYHSRSREQEAEADRIAIERYFGHSPYSYAVIDGAFDVLQYSDLPFDEVPVDHDMLETQFYQFPANYFLQNVAPISDRSEIIDTLSTHPNMEKRRAAAQLLVMGLSDAGRSAFVQPEASFKEIRDLARLECIHLWLVEHEYDKVLYNCHVLKKEMPGQPYLDKAMVTAFYGLEKHKNYGQISEVLSPYKKVEGEMQQMSFFLSKLNRQEISLLALRHAWYARQKYPEDPYYMDLIKEEMRDVFVKNKMKYTDFSDYPMGFDFGSIETETPAPAQETAQKSGKYDKIKRNNQPDMVRPTEKFKTANYMLVDIHRDSLFVALMNAVQLEAENQKILDAISTPKVADFTKIIIFRPICNVAASDNDLKSYMKAYEKSNRLELQMTDNLVKSAKKLKLDPLCYDRKAMSQFDTRQYNDYALLQQWYREYLTASGMEMCYQQTDELAKVAQRLNCSKMCFVASSISNYRFFSYFKLQSLIFSAVCIYTLPFAVAHLALPRYNTRVDVLITDFTTGKQDFHSSNSYNSVMSQAYLNADVYNELYNFVKGKK